MAKHILHWQFHAILLTTMVSYISNAHALKDYNINHQNYNYIDVAKGTLTGRNKGQTTRIFTTANELDEEFWLKYLGEDFHHAVHLQVDDNNNVIQMKDKKPQQQQINYIEAGEKRTRFVRHPLHANKPLKAKSLGKENKNQYPTERLENFSANSNTLDLPATKREQLDNSRITNEKISKSKNKLFIHNKYRTKTSKASNLNSLKAIHKPIVVHLPEMHKSEHQINKEHAPVVFQIPPVIYHRKADLYPVEKNIFPLVTHNGNLYMEEISDENTQRSSHHLHTKNTVSNLLLNSENPPLYSDQNRNIITSNGQDHSTDFNAHPHLSSDNKVPQHETEEKEYVAYYRTEQPYRLKQKSLAKISVAPNFSESSI